jgi:hypothetical protein
MKLQDLLTQLNSLNPYLKGALKDSHYAINGDLSAVEYHRKDSEAAFVAHELSSILSSLEEVSQKLDYLSLPVVAEGQLFKDEDGRYAFACSGEVYTLNSGESFEALLKDEDGFKRWEVVSMEYSHKRQDYFITGHTELKKLAGLTVRLKGAFF